MDPDGARNDFSIMPVADAGPRGLDNVFFATSNTQSFDSDAARAAFRDRWLGRYLDGWPDWGFAAVDGDGTVCGYAVACPENPLAHPAFADHRYYALFAGLCPRYPGHLHINVLEPARGRGVGAALMGRLFARARTGGLPGLHAVTAHGHRNNGFFEAQGFRAAGHGEWQGTPLVFFAKDL